MSDRKRPDPVSPMPEGSSNYEKLVLNLIPRVIRTLGVPTPEALFTMTELIEVYDAILVERTAGPIFTNVEHDEFVNGLLEHVSDEWDGDVSQDFIAEQYVRHLEEEVKRLGGSFSPPSWFQR